MKKNNIQLLTLSLLSYLICILISCSSDDQKGETEKKESVADNQSSTSKDKLNNKSTSTFEEFISKKKDIAIQIYPLRPKGIFDREEAIELYVEIYNPRYIAAQVYKDRLSDDLPKPQFEDFFIGAEDLSWKNNLTLYKVIDTKKTPVSFIYALDTIKSKLNIGQGEIGSMSIMIPPGEIVSEDTHALQLFYNDIDRNLKLESQTSIILKKDHLDKLQIDISMIHYLIMDGKKQEALNNSLELVNDSPESFHARTLLGQVYEENGMIKEAISAYQKSMLLFKVEEGKGYVPEYPVGIWERIKRLEAKLEE